MTKTPRVQLRRLIIKPFLILQAHEDERAEEPLMIILGGLDECEEERAQFDFTSMIDPAAQLKNLPLPWLICSWPEAHLQYTFSRVAHCRREELLLDDECRRDVDRYHHDELVRIKGEYADITPPSWPSKNQFNQLSGSACGLFVFASTGMKYIGNPTYANPANRLKKLPLFLKHADPIGAKNPLAALDLLYTQILTDVPEGNPLITHKILAHCVGTARRGLSPGPAQVACNFLCIDKIAFYGALRKLHSIIAVPAPEHAPKMPLCFHHASFQDVLLDPNRSGRFSIEQQKALIDLAK